MNPMKRVGRMRSVRKVHTGHTATARLQKRRGEEGDGHENGRKLFNNMSSLVKMFQLHSARVHKNKRLEKECATS